MAYVLYNAASPLSNKMPFWLPMEICVMIRDRIPDLMRIKVHVKRRYVLSYMSTMSSKFYANDVKTIDDTCEKILRRYGKSRGYIRFNIRRMRVLGQKTYPMHREIDMEILMYKDPDEISMIGLNITTHDSPNSSNSYKRYTTLQVNIFGMVKIMKALARMKWPSKGIDVWLQDVIDGNK